MFSKNKINIYDYSDYRKFLQEFYELEKSLDPTFSYRVFATAVNMDASLLVKILQGKRHVSPKCIETFVQFFRFKEAKAEYFREMVAYGKAKTAEMTAVKIDDLFRSASAIMTPICEKKQNVLTFQNGSASHIHGNAELLLQVLINLIVNATRHTDGGQITVNASDAEGFVSFTVTDTGSGIAPEAEPHIFEKGYSTDDGRGLGLAICVDTVRLHGGELSLASTSPEGSVFRFIVPKEVKS